MISTSTRAVLVAGLCVGTAGACAPPDEERTVVAGQYVEVELDVDLDICAGQLGMYDEFVVRAASLVGRDVPEDFIAPVHAWTERSRDQAPEIVQGSEGGIDGVAVGGEAFILDQDADLHELGHVIYGEVLGDTIRSLQEGVAEVPAGAPGQAHVAQPSTPLGEFLFEELPEFDATDYFHAAMFVRYVVDTYGVATYRELHRSLTEMADEPDRRARFGEIIGASVEEVDAEFAADTRCAYQIPWCGDFFSAQALPIDIDERLDCAAPETLGYRGPEPERYSPYRVIRFDLESSAGLSMVGSAVRWGLRRCGECSEQLQGGFVIAEEGEVVDATAPSFEFPPGRYYVIAEAIDPDVPVQLRIEQLP